MTWSTAVGWAATWSLFPSDPLSGAGLPIWLPAGAAARRAVEEHVRERERRAGYQHVDSPPLGKRELFELSGHPEHFSDDMFPPMRVSERRAHPAAQRLPAPRLVYRSRGRSYRELPLRIAELGRDVPGRTGPGCSAGSLRLRDGRALDPIPVSDALRLVTDVATTHSADLLPA